MQPLTELLTDDEYKTRANAAGALGNLVRNSSMLCTPIVQARALQVMLQLPRHSWCIFWLAHGVGPGKGLASMRLCCGQGNVLCACTAIQAVIAHPEAVIGHSATCSTKMASCPSFYEYKYGAGIAEDSCGAREREGDE